MTPPETPIETPPGTPLRRSVVIPFWQDRPPAEDLLVGAAADALGYGELWIGEMATYDAFALATAIGVRATGLTLTVGPLAVHVRTPVTMAVGAASVAALTGRPVRLAIGSSSTVVVERWHGRPRRRPAAALDQAARALRALLAGERADVPGDVVATGGYRLRLPAPGAHLTMAAFGDGALRAAARHADRVVLNMVTPAAVAAFRARLDALTDELGRPRLPLAVWLLGAVDPADEAVAQGLRGKVSYLAAQGYGEMFAAAGFGAVVDLARSGARPGEVLAALGPELLDAVALVGPEAAVRARLDTYHRAGADEVALVPATAGDPGGARTLEALRPAPQPEPSSAW